MIVLYFIAALFETNVSVVYSSDIVVALAVEPMTLRVVFVLNISLISLSSL